MIQDLQLQAIPLKPSSKIPKVKWKDYRYNPDDFTHANTGILTGTKHTLTDMMGYQTDLFLTVVDIDISDQEIQQKIVDILSTRFGNTYTVKTGGDHAGLHLYYLTDEPIQKKITLKTKQGNIELLGKNHYVVASGSEVKKRYTENKPLTIENISRTYTDMLIHVLTSISQPTNKTASQKNQSTTRQQKKVVLSKAEKRTKTDANNTGMGNTDKNTQKCKQVTKYSHYLFTDSDTEPDYISKSKKLWQLLLAKQAKKVYKNWQFSDKNLLCVFHKEKRSSADLFIDDQGRYHYHDFHNDQTYNIVQFFKAMETGSHEMAGNKYKEWKIKLMQYIKENAIDTGLADPYDTYIRGLDLSFLLADQMRVMIELFRIGRDHYNVGQHYFLASARHISELTDIPYNQVNRLMNQLCFLGLILKSERFRVDSGFTYKYSIPKADPELVKQRFDILSAHDLLDWRKFKKQTVALLIDDQTASDLFRRDPDPIKLTKADKEKLKWMDETQQAWEKEHDYDDLAPEPKEYIYDAETGDIYTYTPDLEDIERMNDYPSIEQIDQMVAFYQRE